MRDTSRPRSREMLVRAVVVASMAVGVLAAPLLAVSQPSQGLFRVGCLAIGGRTPDGGAPVPLRETMQLRADVIATNGGPATMAAKQATRTIPQAARIAILWNANDQGMTLRYREIEKTARKQSRPDAMFLVADGPTTGNRKLFVEFAAAQRIPAMYEWNFIVREGGLMSYGVSMEDTFGVAARYIDRILRGASPARARVTPKRETRHG